MIVGSVTIDGIPVGSVDVEAGPQPSSPPAVLASLEGSSPELETLGAPRGHGEIGRGGPVYGPHTSPAPRRPTFRHGVGPGSEATAKSDKPQHFTVADIKALEQPQSGTINRAHHRAYLAAHPELREKLLAAMYNEQGVNLLGVQAVAEETMNRADVRGQSLEQTTRFTDEPGGYYAGHYRGPIRDPRTREVLNAALDRALAGSNISKWATDNSSGALAAREARGGEFTYASSYTGETFWTRNSERAAHEEWKKRATIPATPIGVTRLERPTGGVIEGDKFKPVQAVGGAPPKAFIFHHTGGGGTPGGVEDTLRQRGLGVEYIMDREGNITVAGGPGAANILPGWGAGAGLNNSNVVGMEVIAHNDKDVTPAQVAAAKAFINKNYPNTPVFGHGEVNPGHKEADEGATIVNAIRAERSKTAASGASPL